MSAITTHVLDTAKGKPARGVPVQLEYLNGDGSWKKIAEGVTDADGRLKNLLSSEFKLERGTYKICFETSAYLGEEGFYPFAHIVFKIADPSQHYHIPLLLSPFGYSTYRGS